MIKTDYYDILGITKNANERDIKRAYKKLAMKYHPDRNPGNSNAEKKFKEIKKVYEILKDKQKRSAYDQYGESAFDQGDFNNSNINTDFSDVFSDIFSDVFTSSHKKQSSNRGSDLNYNIELSLEEAVFGVIRDIKLLSLEECNICNGTGTKKGTSIVTCIKCNGYGNIQTRKGFFTVQQTCPFCKGQGSKNKEPCYKCKGDGRIKKNKIIKVKIPSGVDTGDRVKLAGEGESGVHGASDGDLYVKVNVRKHLIFEREENNLYCEIPINYVIAALGGEIEVPTLNGRVKLKIPLETQTGKLFRIRGKGVKSTNNFHKGDLFCKVLVETPINLNDKQKNILCLLKESFNESDNFNNPKFKNFFNKIEKFFNNFKK